MSEQSEYSDTQAALGWIGLVFCAVILVSLCIAVGFLAGAGWGWLAFTGVLLFGFYQFLKFIARAHREGMFK